MMPDCNVNAGGNSAMRLMSHLARIQLTVISRCLRLEYATLIWNFKSVTFSRCPSSSC